MRLAWICVIAACGQPAAPPLTGHAGSAAPAAPEPTVRWAQREITTGGLPAIARDGHAFVIAHRDGDSGRGNPNLTLIEKDRGDREVGRLAVLTSDEVDNLAPVEIEARFASAAGWLHERHAAEHLVPMTALVTGTPTPTPIDDAPAPASAAGVTVRWTPNLLVIERAPGTPGTPSTPIRRTTPASWLAPDYPLCRGCSEVCQNPAFLGGGYVDVARRALIVIISYRGTDTCWEPGSQDHVVTW